MVTRDRNLIGSVGSAQSNSANFQRRNVIEREKKVIIQVAKYTIKIKHDSLKVSGIINCFSDTWNCIGFTQKLTQQKEVQ